MYRVGIDTGGTFTDLVAIGEDGRMVVAKHPSTPRAPVDAFMGVIDKSGLAGTRATSKGSRTARQWRRTPSSNVRARPSSW